jgi:hypothetical protein
MKLDPNPLQQALDNYHVMAREAELLRATNAELRATNAGLLAEVGMLREYLKTADSDRIRLQAIASTMLGRLLSINDTIAGAVKASIREGIDASVSHEDGLDEAARTAQVGSVEGGCQIAPPSYHTQEPPKGRAGTLLAPVEFRR